MTASTLFAAAGQTPDGYDLGEVGDRQLLCVQTFSIARLTSNAVPLVPGSLVVVTGRGPFGGSNASGKTRFLGALSLLLGDPEWRTGPSVGRAVQALLFAEARAGGTGRRYGTADHGYVVGVFADPKVPVNTAITVWCRINQAAPYVQVRWADGQRLVVADSDAERHRLADQQWEALPHSTTVGGEQYARRLYGSAPRCLAHLTERGDLPGGKSLLALRSARFDPEEIGEALIRLTGRSVMFPDEVEGRRELARFADQLVEHRRLDREAHAEEETELAEIRKRRQARRLLDEAEDLWRRHLARGLLDALEAERLRGERLETASSRLAEATAALRQSKARVAELRDVTALEDTRREAEEQQQAADDDLLAALETEAAFKAHAAQLTERRGELEAAATGWSGITVDDAEQRLRDAQHSYARANAEQERAQAAVEEATATLATARQGAGGAAGSALRALRDAEIPAVGLLDSITLSEQARASWEPRLALFAAGVVVADVEAARAALRHLPGTPVIGADLPPEPPQTLDGIEQAPDEAATLLAGLARRFVDEHEPASAADPSLGLHVLGGFAQPITGRAALEQAALEQLHVASTALQAAEATVNQAATAEAAAKAAHAAAVAAAELVSVSAKLRALTEPLATAGRTVEARKTAARLAQRRFSDADYACQHRDKVIKGAERQVEQDEAAAAARRKEVEELTAQGEANTLAYWRDSWGASEDAARELVAGDQRKVTTFRNLAAVTLRKALATLEVDNGEYTTLPEPLAEVAHACELLEAEVAGSAGRVHLSEIAAPLARWLEVYGADDDLREQDIIGARATRAQELATIESKTLAARRALDTLQDILEQRVMEPLRQIEQQLQRLWRGAGRHEARLQVQSLRPSGPEERWRWLITPEWRRGPEAPFLPYTVSPNTAEGKLFTVMLVLAALLASPHPQGRVLILDEIGNDFDSQHLRMAFEAIAATARAEQITVLCSCQNLVARLAADHCGAVLYLRFVAEAEILNRPTLVWGYYGHPEGVRLTAEAVLAGRFGV